MNDKINNDLKQAMLNQDKFTLSVLRMLKSSIIYESRSGVDHVLTDDEVISVIKRQIKSKKSSIDEYTKYNRLDLANDLEKEITILQGYLPEEISDIELNKVIDDVFNEIKPSSLKDMGLIIKEVANRVGNKADMAKVSQIVKSKMN